MIGLGEGASEREPDFGLASPLLAPRRLFCHLGQSGTITVGLIRFDIEAQNMRVNYLANR